MNLDQQELFKLLFEAAGEGIILVNKSGIILKVNERVVEMFGYTKAEITNQHLNILVPKNLREKHSEHLEKYFLDPKSRHMGIGLHLEAATKSEQLFPVEISLNHFESKGTVYVIALITDVTERKIQEKKILKLNQELEQRVIHRTEQLTKSEQLYSTIAKNFPDGTINVFDRDYNFLFVEGKELLYNDINSKSLTGKNFIEFLPTSQHNTAIACLKKTFDGEACSVNIEIDDKCYTMDTTPLVEFNGSIHKVLAIIKNITQQKQAELKIKRNLKKEQELNRMKSRFVSIASHEFRTPLSTILSSTSLISRYSKNGDDEKLNKHINRIKSSVSNLTVILNDFLSIEKLETGKVEVKAEYFDLNNTINLIIENLKGVLKTGQNILFTPAEQEHVIYLDKQLMSNAIVNLLSNASKYSHENQDIRFVVKKQKDVFSINIIDEGIGIPLSEQKHLFERFFRAKNALNINGTGLGLNITQKYMELMNGKINIHSIENKGTDVTLLFSQIQ